MAQFRVEGVDPGSGFDTSIVVDAASPEAAKVKGELKGMVVAKVVSLELPPASTTSPRAKKSSTGSIVAWIVGSLFFVGLLGKFLDGRDWSNLQIDRSPGPNSQPAASQPSGATNRSRSGDITIGSGEFQITETNSSWWRFSWKVNITNNLDHDLQVMITTQWLDANGLEVDTGLETTILRPGDNEITSSDLVNSRVASSVERMNVKARW